MIIQSNKMAEDDSDDFADIANALIITNLSIEFFDDDDLKKEFEAAFKTFDNVVSFNYLKSFRRARVNFSSTEATVAARLKFNETQLCGQTIKCYFAQVPKSMTSDHLLPPKPEKMFLISPPCSPPVGWEQAPESEPVLNLELIEALSRLSPDDMEGPSSRCCNTSETHEVQPPSEAMPGIVVHVCEDPEGYADRPTILQTRRPERN